MSSLGLAADAMGAVQLLDHQLALFELQSVFAVAQSVRSLPVLVEEVTDSGLVVRIAQHQRHARDLVVVGEAQPRVHDGGDVHRAGRLTLRVGALFRCLEVVAGALGVAPVRIVGILAVDAELESVPDSEIRADAALEVEIRAAVVRQDGDVPVERNGQAAVDRLGLGHGRVVVAFAAQFVEQLLHVDVGAILVDHGRDEPGQRAGAVVDAPLVGAASPVGQDFFPGGEVRPGADLEAESEVRRDGLGANVHRAAAEVGGRIGRIALLHDQGPHDGGGENVERDDVAGEVGGGDAGTVQRGARVALAQAAHVDELPVDERQAAHAAQRRRDRGVSQAGQRLVVHDVDHDLLLLALLDQCLGGAVETAEDDDLLVDPFGQQLVRQFFRIDREGENGGGDHRSAWLPFIHAQVSRFMWLLGIRSGTAIRTRAAVRGCPRECRRSSPRSSRWNPGSRRRRTRRPPGRHRRPPLA